MICIDITLIGIRFTFYWLSLAIGLQGTRSISYAHVSIEFARLTSIAKSELTSFGWLCAG